MNLAKIPFCHVESFLWGDRKRRFLTGFIVMVLILTGVVLFRMRMNATDSSSSSRPKYAKDNFIKHFLNSFLNNRGREDVGVDKDLPMPRLTEKVYPTVKPKIKYGMIININKNDSGSISITSDLNEETIVFVDKTVFIKMYNEKDELIKEIDFPEPNPDDLIGKFAIIAQTNKYVTINVYPEETHKIGTFQFHYSN